MPKSAWRLLESLKTSQRKSSGWDEVCPHPLESWDRETLWRDVLAELGSRGCGAGASTAPGGFSL